jgi:ABC-type multidrug transport system fused ATPase/permease subunit
MLKGDIVFKSVNLDYRRGAKIQRVLHNLSFSIKAGEKVGLVGRTGAGKSSIVSVLLGLVLPSAGIITIDKIRTSNMNLNDLRQNIFVIPQDPVAFHGTVRYNLDPLGLHTDIELMDAMGQVLKLNMSYPMQSTPVST